MNKSLDDAICYAVKCHSGQKRKAGGMPYIVHPLEVFTILVSMDAPESLLIAGLLHDVLEDTGAKQEEVSAFFGPEVLSLVLSHTEDKSHSWKKRKTDGIAFLKTAGREEKLLVLADQLANLRSIHHSEKKLHEAVFDCFNAGKKDISWYYRSSRNAMSELAEDEEAREVFAEYSRLIDSIFPEDAL